jgi:hypothetical protein
VADPPARYELPLGRLFGAVPVLPAADPAATLAFYRRLGFAAGPPAPDGSVTAAREAVALCFAAPRGPAAAGRVLIRVDELADLAGELAAAGVPVATRTAPDDDPVRLLVTDPDGTELVFVPARPGAGTAAPSPPPPGAAAGPGPERVTEFATALRLGDVAAVTRLLADDPALATSLINGYWPLHLYADAPGHRPNPAAIVAALTAAGAGIDEPAVEAWHQETALHWAASNDDVELIDVLLDAGADLHRPGSSIDGGPPAESALGYGQWAAVRRLWQRGAPVGLSALAGLGELALVSELVEAAPPPSPDDLGVSLWNASRAGHLDTARYLAAHGADLNWPAP